MTNWTRYDPELDRFVRCDGRVVACAVSGCENEGIEIEVANDPIGVVICGACGHWIIAPAGVESGAPVEIPEPGDVPESGDEVQT